MKGTRVTCRDLETDEAESVTIVNDYVLTCDGDCYLAGSEVREDGTHVLTIKGRRPS